MWFNPSDFKKAPQDPTAIFAISAIPETQNSKTAEIATPSLVIPEIENSKIAGIANQSESNNADFSVIDSAPSGEILSVQEEDRHHCHGCRHLRSGYCFKQQFRPVDDIPRRCEDFIGSPKGVGLIGYNAASEMVPKTKPAITCKTCMNFESYHAHGGAGTCKADVMPYGACWWADTVHQCDKYLSSARSEAEHNAQGRFFKFLVTRSDGAQFYSCSMPRMTLAEVREQYADAAAIEPVTGEEYPND